MELQKGDFFNWNVWTLKNTFLAFQAASQPQVLSPQ